MKNKIYTAKKIDIGLSLELAEHLYSKELGSVSVDFLQTPLTEKMIIESYRNRMRKVTPLYHLRWVSDGSVNGHEEANVMKSKIRIEVVVVNEDKTLSFVPIYNYTYPIKSEYVAFYKSKTGFEQDEMLEGAMKLSIQGTHYDEQNPSLGSFGMSPDEVLTEKEFEDQILPTLLSN